MNGTKIRGMIGLALRARKAAKGMDACRLLIRSGKCGILLMDGKTSFRTMKKCREMCERTGTPVGILPERLIGEAAGSGSMLLGLYKGPMAEQVLAMMDSDS